jgi:hypothetical protein
MIFIGHFYALFNNAGLKSKLDAKIIIFRNYLIYWIKARVVINIFESEM